MKHLETILQNNALPHYLVAGAIALIIFFLLVGLRYFISTRIRRMTLHTATYWDDILVDVFASTSLVIIAALSVLSGLLALEKSPEVQTVLLHLIIVLFLCQLGFSFSKGVSTWVRYRIKARKKLHETADRNNYSIIGFVLHMVAWIIVLLLILDNLGVNITALVASLGIGGIAIALAVQNVLGDLFASLSITLDKPFVVGDYIVVDDLSGTVRNIGLKTTRVTSLTGEELIFSNAELLKSRVHNYRKMETRRIVFTIGVTFDTPPEKLEQIPAIVQDIFSRIDKARLDRVHFSRIGQSSLDYEIVYFVDDPDYRTYMDIQQAANLALIKRFADEKIEFAFPTQTLYVSDTGKASPAP